MFRQDPREENTARERQNTVLGGDQIKLWLRHTVPPGNLKKCSRVPPQDLTLALTPDVSPIKTCCPCLPPAPAGATTTAWPARAFVSPERFPRRTGIESGRARQDPARAGLTYLRKWRDLRVAAAHLVPGEPNQVQPQIVDRIDNETLPY